MIKKIVYIADDGCEFENETEALDHENEVKKIKTRKEKIITLNNGKEISRDEVIEYFDTLTKNPCKFCSFFDECVKLREHMRNYTSDTFVLCDVIKGINLK